MLIENLNIKLGADPEVFVSDLSGKFVSAHNMIKGTKRQPHKVDKGAVQVDGMALEFNIDPAENRAEFVTNINTVMSQLAALVPDYSLETSAVAEFGQETMRKTPRMAKEMGCEPDFDAYKGGMPNPKPNGEVDFRTAAGHIHIGWDEDIDTSNPAHIQACIALTKQLDYYLGLPSLLLDDCTKRRELYGKAGAFRVKPYGMEYRVLSNFWLKDEKLMEWVYNNSILAVKEFFKGNLNERVAVPNIINGSLKDAALALVNHNNIPMPEGYSNV